MFGPTLYINCMIKEEIVLFELLERLFELQHVKTPVFLKMHKLLEDKKNLPLTLSDGFKQVSDLIGEITALSFFFFY